MTLINRIEQADHRLVISLQTRLQPKAVAAFKLMSRSGDGYLQEVSIVLAIWIATDTAYIFLQAAAAAFAIERTLYIVAKRRFRRNRPAAALAAFDALVQPSDEFSFPSGHTMAAFLLATLLVLTVGVSPLLVFAWATLVGMSRVALGVHFPSDVVVGAAIGVGIGMLAVVVT